MAGQVTEPRKTHRIELPVRCAWHAKKKPYLEWHEWAEAKTKAGHRQKRCPKCNLLFFKPEYGNAPRGASWRLLPHHAKEN